MVESGGLENRCAFGYPGFESLPLRHDSSGEVSEWLKEHAWKACVVNATAGSNPALSAIIGAVAQLGERYVRNVQVVGSNPIGSTRLC